jgi:L-lysine 6-transaminase
LEPDIVAFGKKVQVGGIMAGLRLDEVPGNVFAVSGRISSTWGGGLVDMVRSQRILEIIEREQLFDHAANTGKWLLAELTEIARRNPWVSSNARGQGLMCALDLTSGQLRDAVVTGLLDENVIVVPCGERSIRFRPALNITEAELGVGLAALDRVLTRLR